MFNQEVTLDIYSLWLCLSLLKTVFVLRRVDQPEDVRAVCRIKQESPSEDFQTHCATMSVQNILTRSETSCTELHVLNGLACPSKATIRLGEQ